MITRATKRSQPWELLIFTNFGLAYPLFIPGPALKYLPNGFQSLAPYISSVQCSIVVVMAASVLVIQ